MEIEEAIDIIDKELHKKWDKTIEKKDGKTYIHLGDEEPLNEFEKASQRCLIEVQSLNREIERQKEIIRQLDIKNLELTTIIKEVREYIEENQEEHKYTDRGGFTYTEGHFLRDSDTLLEILDKVGDEK